MKKKFVSILISFVMVVCVSGVAFADGVTLPVTSSVQPNYSVGIGANSTTVVTFSVNIAAFGGRLLEIPLVGSYQAGDLGGVAYLHTYEGALYGVSDVVGGDGLAIPYIVNGNSLFVVPDDSYLNYITFNINFSSDTIITSAVDNHLTVNSTVTCVDHGEIASLSLSDLLNSMDYTLDNIDANLELMRQYLFWVRDESTESNKNLDNIIGKLEWIVAEMEGNAVGPVLGDYTGYNYSQLFVEVINAIKNISIGDISGNITVQTDLSQVIENLITVSNAYKNINQFDYTGKMYFRPVSVVALSPATETQAQSIFNPTIEYFNMVGLPSFRLDDPKGRYNVSSLNMKMGIGSDTTFPLMPGRYRFRIRILTPANYTFLDSLDGTAVYFYNTIVDRIYPEWSSTADQYSSGYITHSCEFELEIPSGNYPGSLQLEFSGTPSGRPFVIGSKFTIEVTDLDITQTDIRNSVQRIEQLVARNNELLAGLTGTVENDGLSDAMQDFDGYENDAQTNFDDHMTVVDDAMSTITGVTTSDKMFSVVSFINGNFTSIWEALGQFKYLIILNLLAGLALVFVGRSGKVK